MARMLGALGMLAGILGCLAASHAVGGNDAKPAATRPMAEYEAKAKEVREALPKDFTVVIQPPFVVAGNGGSEAVNNSAKNTVKWAVDHLKQDYFDKEPADLITIYLFKDKASYDKYNSDVLKEDPGTPYGFYSPAHKALIMNIATGGGTLVHEIVHPFVAANFPDCPTWFNEGLGSMYEQSAEKDGHIVGLTNWRLPILQKAITAKKLPPFKDLFAMDAETFYGDDRGTNYAQSRNLLYYLQEHHLLVDYYKAFLKNREKDTTGLETMNEILKEKDLATFQPAWEKWVMTLHYP